MVRNTQAEIWGRLIEPDKADLSPDAANSLLALGFKKTDRDRMNYLAAQARAGRLSDAEQVELQEYLRAGDVLALLKSKARQSLQRAGLATQVRTSRQRPARHRANGASGGTSRT